MDDVRKIAERLRDMRQDIMEMELPPRLARLLDEPPDRPPPGAGGMRAIAPHDDAAEPIDAFRKTRAASR